MDSRHVESLSLSAKAVQVLESLQLPDMPPGFYRNVARLREVVLAGHDTVVGQHDAKLTSKERRHRKKVVREELRERFCGSLVKVSRGNDVVIGNINVGGVLRFTIPYQRWSDFDFLLHVKSMFAEAQDEKYVSMFHNNGLDEQFFNEFNDKIKEFETLMRGMVGSGIEKMSYRFGVEGRAREARRILSMIDAVLYPKLLGNPQALAVWQQLCPSSKQMGGRFAALLPPPDSAGNHIRLPSTLTNESADNNNVVPNTPHMTVGQRFVSTLKTLLGMEAAPIPPAEASTATDTEKALGSGILKALGDGTRQTITNMSKSEPWG